MVFNFERCVSVFQLKDDPESSRSELEKKRGEAYKAALEVTFFRH
jgi:hypothetical protein